MNFNDFEKDIIFEYWKTLKRKNILNISHNNFIKKPYLENYIVDLSVIIDNNNLINNIKELIDDNIISNDDILLSLCNNIELNLEEKKNIEKIIFMDREDIDTKDIDTKDIDTKDINTKNGNEDDNEDNDTIDDNEDENNRLNIKNNYETIFNELFINIIIYQVKYFRFYQTVNELIFNNDKENNELYNFIYVYIKNKPNDIKIYSNKNIYFMLFFNYINELFYYYLNIFRNLIKYNIINNSYTDKDIHHLFIKNIFHNWYTIYKKDILEQKFEEKCKPYKFKTNILSKILCLPNL